MTYEYIATEKEISLKIQVQTYLDEYQGDGYEKIRKATGVTPSKIKKWNDGSNLSLYDGYKLSAFLETITWLKPQ